MGSAQRVVVARARVPRDAAEQHCLEYRGSEHPDLELEGSARSVVQFEGVLPEAAPCVAYAPVDLDGQFGIVVDVPPEVYELVRWFVHLARCLYADYGMFVCVFFNHTQLLLFLTFSVLVANPKQLLLYTVANPVVSGVLNREEEKVWQHPPPLTLPIQRK